MFGKKFLKDKDLEFLEECSNEDLKVLADLLVYDKDNNPRYSETLSRTRLYKESYPNQLQKAWTEIAHEFQLYGGDSFANFFRWMFAIRRKSIITKTHLRNELRCI